MNADRPEIDPTRVRRLFETAGKRRPPQGEHDFIVREVSKRMAERLEYIKLAPARALDAGCGSGADLVALRKRFPQTQWQALDFAFSRVAAGRAEHESAFRTGLGLYQRLGLAMSRKSQPVDWVCGDFGALPFAARSLDFIWSNLALHWHGSPHRVFPEWARTLNVGGLVLFSAFGPDTLKEVSNAFAAAGRGRQTGAVLPFTDMHDYGDMLVDAGFVTPVVDAERLTLTYSNTAALWRDVRALGGNALADGSRNPGLGGRGFSDRLNAALKAQKGADGRYPLSFEIIYGHAWKGQPKTVADGRSIVHLELPRRPRRT